MEKKANHRVNIVRLTEPRVHSNADSLELFDIVGYQVVVKKGQFKAGDLAVYIQPDSVVPQTEPFKFIWEGRIGLDGAVPTKGRRITVRKFRKEMSEGLLMPISDFKEELCHVDWNEGTDVSDTLGITHYEATEGTAGSNSAAPKRKARRPKTVRGWANFLFYNAVRYVGLGRLFGMHESSAMDVSFDAPTYDVEALKCFSTHFENDEVVYVSEKIHGSNARYVFLDGTMYAGSHYQWKSPDSPCVFTRALKDNPWIEQWCRANEGAILYGEATGMQKNFTYGAGDSVRFFAFDIRVKDGWIKPYGLLEDSHCAPVLYRGRFDLALIKASLVDGPSMVEGANHIREGVVISAVNERSVRGVGRLNLKIVSNAFLERDGK